MRYRYVLLLVVTALVFSSCELFVDDDLDLCYLGCKHVVACREKGYDDTDLQQEEVYANIGNCLSWCDASMELYMEDAQWEISCAAHTASCEKLDEYCDVF